MKACLMMLSSCLFVKTLVIGLYNDENRRFGDGLYALTGLLGNENKIKTLIFFYFK